jgi:UDP-N-acetylglucosamine--N-acetylmuramyl-(pentapeptide) pyrophosphoryl-undecaprenol N-acetylglucosamine transferase
MERFFPKEKILMTGNPVRQDIKDVKQKRNEAISFFKLDPNRKTILVIGGSLGARTINEAMGNGLQQLADNNIQLIWQTGKGYFAKAKEQTAAFAEKNICSFDFIQRMDLAYAAADIVVSRAGASSVSELCNIGMPCILVPSPNVAEDHQTKNAMALVNKNAAILVKDAEASGNLVKTAVSLISDTGRQNELSKNISSLAFHNSANVIANEVLKLAGYTK